MSDMALESDVTLKSYARTHSVLKLSKRVLKDSKFPFSPGDHLRIRISGDHLVVERVPTC